MKHRKGRKKRFIFDPGCWNVINVEKKMEPLKVRVESFSLSYSTFEVVIRISGDFSEYVNLFLQDRLGL